MNESASEQPVIEIDHVWKSFGQFTPLRDVSLRRNARGRGRCQHLAKAYDAAHPRARRK